MKKPKPKQPKATSKKGEQNTPPEAGGICLPCHQTPNGEEGRENQGCTVGRGGKATEAKSKKA